MAESDWNVCETTGGTMASIHIEGLTPERAPQACRVLAQAFVTNPLNIAAFGPSQLAM